MAAVCASLGFVAGIGLGIAVGAYRLARAQRAFDTAWQARAEEADRIRLWATHLSDQVDGLFHEING